MENQKKAYEDALQRLEPKLGQVLQANRPKLAQQQNEVKAAKSQAETTAQSEDYVQALKSVEDLSKKVDAYFTAQEELDKKKKAYEDAVAEIEPRLKLGLPKDAASIKQQMKAAAKNEDYDLAMKLLNDLKAALKTLSVVAYQVGFYDGRGNSPEHEDNFKEDPESLKEYKRGYAEGLWKPPQEKKEPPEMRPLTEKEIEEGKHNMEEYEERQKILEELLEFNKELSQENPSHLKLTPGSNNPRVPPRPIPRAPMR